MVNDLEREKEKFIRAFKGFEVAFLSLFLFPKRFTISFLLKIKIMRRKFQFDAMMEKKGN